MSCSARRPTFGFGSHRSIAASPTTQRSHCYGIVSVEYLIPPRFVTLHVRFALNRHFVRNQKIAGLADCAPRSEAMERAEVCRVIVIPVPGWVAIILAALGIIVWTYDLLVVKPRRRRQRLARKRDL